MKEPVLVVMAAGMGSRYGGLKQIDPVDQEGHIIMDFSIYDAVRAGFKKVIFIIKKENEQDFRDAIGDCQVTRWRSFMCIRISTNILKASSVPEGREVSGEPDSGIKLRRRDRRTVCGDQCR